jgi:hypothetical protein
MDSKKAPVKEAGNYVTACNSLMARLNELRDSGSSSWRQIARRPEFLGISATTLWKVSRGYRPKGKTRELLGLPVTRVRIAADVTEAQRSALRELATSCNLSWSEYCRELADNYIKENETK